MRIKGVSCCFVECSNCECTYSNRKKQKNEKSKVEVKKLLFYYLESMKFNNIDN